MGPRALSPEEREDSGRGGSGGAAPPASSARRLFRKARPLPSAHRCALCVTPLLPWRGRRSPPSTGGGQRYAERLRESPQFAPEASAGGLCPRCRRGSPARPSCRRHGCPGAGPASPGGRRRFLPSLALLRLTGSRDEAAGLRQRRGCREGSPAAQPLCPGGAQVRGSGPGGAGRAPSGGGGGRTGAAAAPGRCLGLGAEDTRSQRPLAARVARAGVAELAGRGMTFLRSPVEPRPAVPRRPGPAAARSARDRSRPLPRLRRGRSASRRGGSSSCVPQGCAGASRPEGTSGRAGAGVGAGAAPSVRRG